MRQSERLGQGGATTPYQPSHSRVGASRHQRVRSRHRPTKLPRRVFTCVVVAAATETSVLAGTPRLLALRHLDLDDVASRNAHLALKRIVLEQPTSLQANCGWNTRGLLWVEQVHQKPPRLNDCAMRLVWHGHVSSPKALATSTKSASAMRSPSGVVAPK
jgi:hypothetical protein